MKQISILILFSTAILSSCSKQSVCIGSDCVFPEAVVSVDSIANNMVYATLINQDGQPYISTLKLSPEINQEEFFGYVNFPSSMELESPSPSSTQFKIYYISADQSYVLNNYEYINASSTNLEIVAFGDHLHLTN